MYRIVLDLIGKHLYTSLQGYGDPVMNVCSVIKRIKRIMAGKATDERLGCRALHRSPGGEWWVLFAFIRTSTGPASRRALLYSDCWILVDT